MLTNNLFVVTTPSTGDNSWMRPEVARSYCREAVTKPNTTQIVVMGPVDTHVWHKGEGWTTITTAEFRQRISATI